VDVRIGLSNTPREVALELDDDTDTAKLKAKIEAAVTKGGMVGLEDRKGRQVGLVAEKVSYIDLGTKSDKGRIGFG
jgi:hypothetical protein